MISEPFQQNDKSFLTIEKWISKIKGLEVGFTTKLGGVSKNHYSSLNLGLHVQDDQNDCITNRKIISSKTSIPYENWVFAEQVHGNRIEAITDRDRGRGLLSYEQGIPKCDGFYTHNPNIMLSLCFADCVPLYFLEPNRELIGLAHAGWKGTVKNIGGEMVKTWIDREGVNPSEIMAVIGPSIGGCCYIVDDKVITAIQELKLQEYPSPYVQISSNQYKLNLKQLNKNLLLESGIKEENIMVSRLCTCCEKELFFSHRRDDGKTGRMLSFIGINREA